MKKFEKRKSIMMKFKKIAYLLITIFALNNCSAKLVEINNFNTMASSKLGDIKLHHDEYGFCVEQDGELRDVQNCFVDKEIRNLTSEELQIQLGNIKKVEIDGQEIILERLSSKIGNKVFDAINESAVKTICLSEEESEEIISSLSQSAYIQIVEMSDGEFALHFHPRLPGGGIFGGAFGAYAGKFIVSGVCHGTIAVISGTVGVFGTPAAGTATFLTLESTFGSTIEAASISGAMIGTVVGAVFTGLV